MADLLTPEELQAKLEELAGTVSNQQQTIDNQKKVIDGHDKALLEHAQKHEDQGKVNVNIGKALKAVGTGTPTPTGKIEKKKPEPLITPKTELTITVGGNEGKYVFTGPKAKDKDGQVILTATIAESPDDYTAELQNWVKTGSGILKKKL